MLAGTGEFGQHENSENNYNHEHEEDDKLLNQDILKNTINSSEKKTELSLLKDRIKKHVFILTSLVCLLDGYLLLFIGYNQSIFKKEWKWKENLVELLNIIYHIITALGGIFSAFSTNVTNLKGLNWNIFLVSFSLICSICLINSQNYYLFSSTLCLICFTNGHLFNIGTNIVIYKYSPQTRAFVYSIVLFFIQFGKFIFATIIYKFNNILILGDLKITIFPIIFLLIIKLLFNISIVHSMISKIKIRTQLKSEQECFEKVIPNNVNDISLSYHLESKNKKIILKNNSQSIIVLGDKIQVQTMKNVICSQIFELFTNNHFKEHTYKLAILNISLGIQFFSMINIFPHLSDKVYFFSNLVDEIFFSKVIHTILLTIFPIIFLFKFAKRKYILLFTFSLNLALNFFFVFNIFNAIIMIHAFRFLWSISFITIDVYTAEAINRKYRNMFTSLMYMLFKISCIIEIMTIDRLISISIYIPIIFNIILQLIDVSIAKNLECEPHFLHLEEIESFFNKK